VWEKRGIHDYLIFAKETPDSHKFRWEIIPFSKDGFRFWKQFNVLWNVIFGSSCLSEKDQIKIVENFQAENDLFSDTSVQQMDSFGVIGEDPFCQQKIIDRQIVFEGKEINILYNYAPIGLGEDRLHFLIVPKQHRPGFSDLTETEYLEAMDLVQNLVNFYTNKGYEIVYIFDKTGVEAGQTVPHWHEHVIFATSKTQEFVAKLMVLKNMLFSSSPMGEEELEKNWQRWRKKINSCREVSCLHNLFFFWKIAHLLKNRYVLPDKFLPYVHRIYSIGNLRQ
jgi:diadenosine tetraphosphate (Ap4A) HIT family hydrolase